MKLFINISRIFVGILFIFSGIIKANDPLGLSYKMQEFFEVWNIHWLDNYTLAFSIIMIAFEIVAGVAILLGWRMKLFSWLLLLLILFFTFLTGYAFLSDKIKECGCFGNCIPLTAGQSFAKDILLLVLIVFLFINKEKIKPFLSNLVSGVILILTVIISFSFQWFVLQHLPLIDCLPYKVGVNIPKEMKVPVGAIPDSTVISFVYQKNGKELEFTADKFPADFDDSYKFIKRYDKLIRKGNAEPAIKDFNLITLSGNDSTQDVLQKPGYTILVFAKEMPDSNPSWNKDFAGVFTAKKMKNIPLYFVTANAEQVEMYLGRNGFTVYDISILKCDATAIKTAARANPTLYLLKHGTVLGKWSAAEFDNALLEISKLPVQADNPDQQ